MLNKDAVLRGIKNGTHNNPVVAVAELVKTKQITIDELKNGLKLPPKLIQAVLEELK